MTKFIIEKINIEKSDKDIQTGISYELSQGLNIICGNNEDGKSSLMKFIKEGFFRPAKVDTGKIFFSINNNKFRVDIKNSNKKADRCKLYDNNENEIEYEIIEKFINQKYFEQGFTINLDDLTNLKYDNELSLINVIKDPSGDKLNSLLSPFTSKITECIGEKGKPLKALNKITIKIKELNDNINKLSNKEYEYINAVHSIKQFEKELENLNEKEQLINYLINKQNNDKRINELTVQLQEKEIIFNPKLYEAREDFAQLAQSIGKYDSNSETIERSNNKLTNINKQISQYFQLLKDNLGIYAQENEILNFDIDFNKISQIKNLLEDINNKNADIKVYEKNIEDRQETLLKLENDYNFILHSNKNYSEKEIENLFHILDEGLKQIKSLDFDISEIEKESVQTKNITLFKKIFFSFSAFTSIILSAYFLTLDKTIYASIFIIIFLLLVYLTFIYIRKSEINEKIERKQSLKKNIIKELYAQIKNYYTETQTNFEGFFAISKLEEIRQELKNSLDKLLLNNQDSEFNKSKIKNDQEKIAEIKNSINHIETSIQEYLQNNITTDAKTYIEAVNIIKELKSELTNKIEVEKEHQELEQQNLSIINDFNIFLKEKEININITTDIKENFETLRKYNEDNTSIKKEIDELHLIIQNIKLEDKETSLTKNFPEISMTSDLEYLLNETKEKKRNIQEQKHIMDVQKSKLEDVESIVDLKNERNASINEYRKLIEEIITSRAILNITTIAKNNFDKTQPDLVNAERYLNLLTNGKYSKINLELQEISDTSQTVIKKWDELSRGTKEQLYLALRLGYASNYTIKDPNRPNLPLIIDDAFVNFDTQRTQSALNCLIEFSKTNQILFFTCHTQTIKEHFKTLNYSENINIINLQGY